MYVYTYICVCVYIYIYRYIQITLRENLPHLPAVLISQCLVEFPLLCIRKSQLATTWTIYVYIYICTHVYICKYTALHSDSAAPCRVSSGVTCLSHMCGMIHSYVRHDLFLCVTWLVHKCEMTHSYVCPDLFVIPQRLVEFPLVWHDAFICMTCITIAFREHPPKLLRKEECVAVCCNVL